MPLGIPTIQDWVVQMLAKIHIETNFETDSASIRTDFIPNLRFMTG